MNYNQGSLCARRSALGYEIGSIAVAHSERGDRLCNLCALRLLSAMQSQRLVRVVYTTHSKFRYSGERGFDSDAPFEKV